MEHPFINSLSDKTLEELQQALSSLTTRLTFAHRTGNGAMISQIHMIIDSYRTEYNKRMDEMMKKQQIDMNINIENNS